MAWDLEPLGCHGGVRGIGDLEPLGCHGGVRGIRDLECLCCHGGVRNGWGFTMVHKIVPSWGSISHCSQTIE